jgi:glutathione S-transferase
MSSFKLSYFDGRGVAETVRYCFAVSKTEYEDFRYAITFGTPGDFSTMQRPEFDAAKTDGTLAASLNRLPMLECDGVQIGQSKAIERFVATKVGLMGADAVEAAKIDAMCENVRDCKDDYKACKAKGDEELAKFFAEKMPAFMKCCDATAGDGGFLVGGKLSLADVSMFVFLKEFFDNKEGAWAATDGCDKIRAAVDAVAANEEVQAWQKKRPETPF